MVLCVLKCIYLGLCLSFFLKWQNLFSTSKCKAHTNSRKERRNTNGAAYIRNTAKHKLPKTPKIMRPECTKEMNQKHTQASLTQNHLYPGAQQIHQKRTSCTTTARIMPRTHLTEAINYLKANPPVLITPSHLILPRPTKLTKQGLCLSKYITSSK